MQLSHFNNCNAIQIFIDIKVIIILIAKMYCTYIVIGYMSSVIMLNMHVLFVYCTIMLCKVYIADHDSYSRS